MNLALVGQKRRELGIPSITKAREWTEEEISLLGKMSDLKLGAMLGISHDSVRDARLKHNIKSHLSLRRKK